MPAIQPLYLLLEVNHSKFSKEEQLFIEAELFIRICEEVSKLFEKQLKEHFHLMNFITEKESEMLEANFLRLIINDILSTEEYTLEGIARYTCTHEDVVHEVISGRNTAPSVIFFQRALDLHRIVRRDLYREIIKKIASEYAAVA